MATTAKNSGLTAVKKSTSAPAARRLRGSPEKTERDAAIIAAVRAGASRIAVAAEHGITRERVGVILKNAAKAAPVATKPLTRSEFTAKVVALAKARTTAQIAGHLNVSTKRVRNALKRAGVEAWKPSYTRYIPPRTIDPNSMQSRIVGLAGDHTVEEIAGIVGKSKAYVRAALKNRRVFAKDQLPPLRSRSYPSVAEVAKAAVKTELAKPAPVDTDYSIDALRKAFPEFEIPATEHIAEFTLVSRPAPAAAPVDVFVKPNAVYVAEVVVRHGLDAAHERWPFLPFDELCELNRRGVAIISPPVEEPLQPLGVRIWRAIKRVFGRS